MGLQLEVKIPDGKQTPRFERMKPYWFDARDIEQMHPRTLLNPKKVWEGGFFLEAKPKTTKMKVLGAKMYIHKI